MSYRATVAGLFLVLSARPVVADETADFFERRIRPVLAENCFSCHGPKKQQAGLRLDSRDAILKGTDEGAVVIPGSPEKSALLRALRHEKIKMPPKGKLAEQAVQDIAHWIKIGLPWPENKQAIAKQEVSDSAKHWAFQPVRKPAVPVVKNTGWVQSPVDAFILEKLEALQVRPNAPADRRTLIRRAYFDLIGLPPTLDEVRAFEADTSPDAFAKVIDHLLASPHYGERWARHWLDVARYADTKGYVFQEERRYPYAYAYRDYVIRAFNDDLPYDRFILEQLAADQLVDYRNGLTADSKALAGMGFLTLGRRFLNNTHDIIDDRIDVVSRGLLGLTVSCARCHDHKYDPIPIQDYYSLYGVFASSVESKNPPLIEEPKASPEQMAFDQKVAELQAAVDKFKEDNKTELANRNRKFRDALRALERKVDAFKASSPIAPPRAMILEDSTSPGDARVLLRGNPNNPGPPAPRRFLSVLDRERRSFKKGSGRLELAQAIASKDNPLTARVMVNRLWLYHFGAGLVTSTSNFGLRSEPPSHPELLDYLAARFMEDGWSIKKMHRLMMLSSVYQQTSAANEAAAKLDPDNRLLARMNSQRLDLEALRDSLLFVAGNLDTKLGGRAVDITTQPFSHRRTVYGFIDRQNLPGVFRTFDFASPDSTSPQRFQTTVPQQALFLMNSPFVAEQAKGVMNRVEPAEPRTRIGKLYEIVYSRPPASDEIMLGLQFVGDGSDAAIWERYAQVLLLANEFAFVD